MGGRNPKERRCRQLLAGWWRVYVVEDRGYWSGTFLPKLKGLAGQPFFSDVLSTYHRLTGEDFEPTSPGSRPDNEVMRQYLCRLGFTRWLEDLDAERALPFIVDRYGRDSMGNFRDPAQRRLDAIATVLVAGASPSADGAQGVSASAGEMLDAFLARLNEIDKDEDRRAELTRVCKRHVLKRLVPKPPKCRRARRGRHWLDDPNDPPDPHWCRPEDGIEPEPQCDPIAESAAMRDRCRRQMRPEIWDAFQMRVLEGRDYHEAAATLGIALATLYRRLDEAWEAIAAEVSIPVKQLKSRLKDTKRDTR